MLAKQTPCHFLPQTDSANGIPVPEPVEGPSPPPTEAKKMARRPFVRGFPGFRLRSIPTLRFGMAPPPLQSLPLPRLQTIIISFNFFCGKHLCKASVSQVWAPLPAKSLVAGPSDGKNQGILPKGSLLAFSLRPTTKDFSIRCAQTQLTRFCHPLN